MESPKNLRPLTTEENATKHENGTVLVKLKGTRISLNLLVQAPDYNPVNVQRIYALETAGLRVVKNVKGG